MRRLEEFSLLSSLDALSKTEVIRPPRNARHALTVMVAASLIASACGVVQTFWIPRVLPVDGFGYWRMFLLYAGYAGLLHLGLVDGALLRWSQTGNAGGSSSHAGPPALLPGPGAASALRFLTLEHLLLLASAIALAWLYASRPMAWLALALGLYALLFNVAGLLQVRLQADLSFNAVALGVAAPGILFVASFVVLRLTRASVGHLIGAYLMAWGTAALGLLWIARRSSHWTGRSIDAVATTRTWHAGLGCVAAGWPIVLANTGYGLMQSADRVVVNLTRPIHDFAIYSLSQSTIYVPVAILATGSRVAFTHFAGTHGDGRAAIYLSTTRLLTLAWMLLLPYFFAVEFIVRRFLPKYAGGLPAGRILLLSVLFLSLIQIVQLNTYSLEGRQRQFFAGSIFAVAVAFVTAWFGSRVMGSLTAVAWSQVITAMVWWLGNEWFLRKLRLLRRTEVLGVLVSFSLGTATLYLASMCRLPQLEKIVLYYALGTVSLYSRYRPEMREAFTFLSRFLQPRPGQV